MARVLARGFNPAFLAGGGEMGAMMREHDWSTSPLGPPEGWPQSVRSVVGLVLNSRFPMLAVWGEGLGLVYNDAYVEILGEKHPSARGASFADAWADLKPLIDDALAGQPSCALLVDDEELVRMSTADMLIDLGFEVVEATSAEEALRLLETGTMPNLLITDFSMPGMNGVEFARAARAINPTLPVTVSGYAEVDRDAQELPPLTKPFRNAELAESISALIPVAG